MSPLPRRLLVLAAMVWSAGPARSQSSPVKVAQPWARATAASARTGAAYLTLTAIVADAIVAASSPVAGAVELHRTVNENGVMKMLPAPDLPLAAGVPVEMKPGGLHIMLIGLKAPLKRGETFPLTLQFRSAPAVTVQVMVEAPGAAGPAHSH